MYRSLLLVLEKHNIQLTPDMEVDFSQCQDEKIRSKLQKKLPMVKEALLMREMDFGYTHRQNKKEKAIKIEELVAEISGREMEFNREVIERLKNLTIQREEPVPYSDIDREVGMKVHSLSAKPISKEDLYYEQATLDLVNFFEGN